MNLEELSNDKRKPNLVFNTNGNHLTIIQELSNRLLFLVEEPIQKDMETILKYDFNPKSKNAQTAVLRLFAYITKLPEFQLI